MGLCGVVKKSGKKFIRSLLIIEDTKSRKSEDARDNLIRIFFL